MPKEFGNYTADQWDKLREFWFANPQLTLKDLPAYAESITGKSFKYPDIKNFADTNGWEVARTKYLAENGSNIDTSGGSVIAEVNHIRQIVYQQIVAANESGLLLTGDFDRDEVTALLSGIDNLKIVKLRPGGVDAQMVNAYMNLLTKSNVRLDLGTTSGKTSREQLFDAVEEAEKELDDYYRTVASAE